MPYLKTDRKTTRTAYIEKVKLLLPLNQKAVLRDKNWCNPPIHFFFNYYIYLLNHVVLPQQNLVPLPWHSVLGRLWWELANKI